MSYKEERKNKILSMIYLALEADTQDQLENVAQMIVNWHLECCEHDCKKCNTRLSHHCMRCDRE